MLLGCWSVADGREGSGGSGAWWVSGWTAAVAGGECRAGRLQLLRVYRPNYERGETAGAWRPQKSSRGGGSWLSGVLAISSPLGSKITISRLLTMSDSFLFLLSLSQMKYKTLPIHKPHTATSHPTNHGQRVIPFPTPPHHPPHPLPPSPSLTRLPCCQRARPEVRAP